MKYIHKILVSAGVAAAIFACVVALAPTQAVYAVTSKEAACQAINGPAGCTATAGDMTGIITIIVNTMSLIIGVIAVIMIMLAGAKYISSGGDTAKVTAAKNALMYAIIGLVIVALSQFLVRAVLKQTKNIAKPASSTSAKP